MKKYDKDAKCYKCGYGGIEDMHRDEESQAFCNLANNMARAGGSLDNPRDPHPEHINRICRNCGHSWDERPQDSVDHSVSEAIREVIDRSNPFKPAGEAAKSESLAEWMDALADMIAPAVGMPAEMLKRPFPPNDPGGVKATCEMAKTDKPVIEKGDVVRKKSITGCPTGHHGKSYECEILKQEGTHVRLGCLCSVCACWQTVHDITLIRKGPKVHTFKGVEWARGEKGVVFPIFKKPIMETVGNMADNGESYDMTLTERTAK